LGSFTDSINFFTTSSGETPSESALKLVKRRWRSTGAASARVHAYLHRKEGDLDNAAYWYGRAGTQPPRASLVREWEVLATELSADSPP